MEIRIREGRVEDAAAIGRAVVMAITPELCEEWLDARQQRIAELFGALAARVDSQYSYVNTLVAENAESETIGLIISYDGARLHELRKAFVEEAGRLHGRPLDGQIDDETDSTEIYIDTLAVRPAYRGQGVGTALMKAACEKAAASGKPAGLLVDKDNPKARRLYESLGFRKVGERQFFGKLMDHLQR